MPAMTEGDTAVAVCTEISPELAGEGMAREIVHRLQTMRKSAGFEIADYIVTYYEGDDYIQQVMRGFCRLYKAGNSFAPACLRSPGAGRLCRKLQAERSCS